MTHVARALPVRIFQATRSPGRSIRDAFERRPTECGKTGNNIVVAIGKAALPMLEPSRCPLQRGSAVPLSPRGSIRGIDYFTRAAPYQTRISSIRPRSVALNCMAGPARPESFSLSAAAQSAMFDACHLTSTSPSRARSVLPGSGRLGRDIAEFQHREKHFFAVKGGRAGPPPRRPRPLAVGFGDVATRYLDELAPAPRYRHTTGRMPQRLGFAIICAEHCPRAIRREFFPHPPTVRPHLNQAPLETCLSRGGGQTSKPARPRPAAIWPTTDHRQRLDVGLPGRRPATCLDHSVVYGGSTGSLSCSMWAS